MSPALEDELDYYMDGAPMDPDNRPPDSDCYNARRFGDPEWMPRGFLAADMTGAQIDPTTDTTAGLLDMIEPAPSKEKTD